MEGSASSASRNARFCLRALLCMGALNELCSPPHMFSNLVFGILAGCIMNPQHTSPGDTFSAAAALAVSVLHRALSEYQNPSLRKPFSAGGAVDCCTCPSTWAYLQLLPLLQLPLAKSLQAWGPVSP